MLSTKQGKYLNEYFDDYVIFDLETTGISCKCDEIIEISAVKVSKGEVVAEYSRLVNPKKSIPYAASAVNHITNDMVANEPTFEEILPEFLEFIGDNVLVGHNIKTFDMKFIYRDCEKYLGKTIDNDYVDTLRLARKCLKQLKHHRLSDLAEYYGMSTEGAHRALADCRMNQQVYEHLGRELSKEETVESVKTIEPINTVATKKPTNLNKKIIRKSIVNMKLVGDSMLGNCPQCGELLSLINGQFGDFVGCTGYPKCRYTKNKKN